MKVVIEAEPKEIAALIFAVSERRVDEIVEVAIQRKEKAFMKMLEDLNKSVGIAFHAQVEQLRQDGEIPDAVAQAAIKKASKALEYDKQLQADQQKQSRPGIEEVSGSG